MRYTGVLAAGLLMMIALCIAAFSVVASATESNPEWEVEKGGVGVALKAGESEALSSTFPSKGSWVFKQTTGTGIAVSCAENKVSFASGFGESVIKGPRGLQLGPILFESCKVTAPAGDTTCEVFSSGFPNGQIRTQALGFSAEEALEGSTKTPFIRLRPVSTHEEIVTFQLKGGTCTHPGSYEIAGLLVARVVSSEFAAQHQWNFGKSTGTRLTIGGVEAEFTAAPVLALKSGSKWGDF